jgi:AcrR family transcriptional regulator
MRNTYHHGSLRAALLEGALKILRKRGVEGFSLREIARLAGVSPAAPKYHFTDSRALLTALATTAFNQLADQLESADAAGASRADCIRAQGVAYVNFALKERALFDLMWRGALLDLTDRELLSQKERAFGVLDHRVRGSKAAPIPQTDIEMSKTFACWSLVHGFARMALDDSFGPTPSAASRAADELLPACLNLLVERI